jgi:hypothetical protein
MLRLEMDALIADLTAEAGALAADDADAHGRTRSRPAAPGRIDAVRRAELSTPSSDSGRRVGARPRRSTPEPETLTAVVATNGSNVADELRGVTAPCPSEEARPPSRTTRRRWLPGGRLGQWLRERDGQHRRREPDAAAATTDGLSGAGRARTGAAGCAVRG